MWSLIWYIKTLAKFGSWFTLKCKSFLTRDYKEVSHLWWAKLVPPSSVACHLKQVCVAVTGVQGTWDSYFLSHFLFANHWLQGLQGTSGGFQICPPVWSRSKHTCAIPGRSRSSWAVSKLVKKIHRKANFTACCSDTSPIALWLCLQATYKHK